MADDPRLDSLMLRREEMRRRSESVTLEELCSECPELLPALRTRIRATEQLSAVPITLELPGGVSSVSRTNVNPTLDLPDGASLLRAPETVVRPASPARPGSLDAPPSVVSGSLTEPISRGAR